MSITDLELMIQRFSAGSVSLGDIEIIMHFAKDLDLVVELGTNIGTTSILLKSVAKRVCTVDVFENLSLIADEQQRGVYQTSFNNNQHLFSAISNKLAPFGVEVHQGLSHDFAKKFNSQSVGMVFIDADHSYEGAKKDYNAWFDRVKIGGYYAFHDCIPGFPVQDFVCGEMMKDDRVCVQEYYPETGIESGNYSVVVFERIR